MSNQRIGDGERKNASGKDVFVFADPATWYHARTVKGFREHVRYVKAFHCCKPLRMDEYLEKGLLMPEEERMRDLTIRLLGKWVEREKLEEAFKKNWASYPAKGIYFNVNKRLLLEECGHYLIYGSELVTGIAAGFWRREELMAYGTPTIFTALVPTEMLSDETVKELIDCVRGSFHHSPLADFGFRITENLPAKYLVKVEHPPRIRNPLLGGTYYQVRPQDETMRAAFRGEGRRPFGESH